MKAVFLSAFALFLLLIAVILNSLYIGSLSKRYAEDISALTADDIDATREKLEEIYESYKRAKKFISITVSHDDLVNIDETFSDIIGAAKVGMIDEVVIAKSRLRDAFIHLGRLSGINIDSII